MLIANIRREYNRRSELQRTFGIFDGFYHFMPLKLGSKNQWQEVWNEAYSHSDAGAMNLRIVTVTPGWDDRHLLDPSREKSLCRLIDRENGCTYRSMIEFALSVDPPPHMVMVASFNEYHENTHVEPSFNHRSLYLDMTRDFIETGKALWNTEKPYNSQQCHRLRSLR